MTALRRIAVVTGATGGIGRYIALGLVQQGFHVVVVCRDAERGRALQHWIAEQAAPLQDDAIYTELEVADLTSLRETREAGRRIAARHPAMALLVNNAGMFSARHALTPEGRDRVLAVNHLAPYVLIDALEAALILGAPSRIVNVGSSTSDHGGLDPQCLERPRKPFGLGWNMVRAYRESKLAMLCTTITRAERLEGSGVVANVVHPGTVATGLIRERGAIGVAWRLMAPFCLTEAQGAATPLFAATDPACAALTGRYIKKRTVVRPNRRVEDRRLRDDVESATRDLITATVG